MLTIYHNPRCRKSRETLKIIEDAGQMVQVVDYLKMPPSRGELEHIVEKLGIKPAELIRKGEAIYKEKYKNQSLTDAEWLDVLAENPILMERPVVVAGNKAVIGRPPENVKELF
ncbi:arsenate reductase (glutaredoxin) [Fulvivirga sedimenti]|uniref:Arsenate reductase (Glutaredoxin) n=1 Tax=Fulvivirga sedimenti TaxID=2879465 RepID=A0A9X1HUP8_9BACT|nr:arsenate reductase (glutaredoxin) [Fulvivirga sedimenti]MCA6074852.1 arsenate reductase (glutaredoxin) [Fulvivirga sedimenti]MCA6076029.1 arsenate reductase (glutaredoxin) [Fulvivirga sedimenti]MCA6077157.1 arsenate reductase (glutaredoxin) [Fulvivirga sedimenti]